MQRKNTILGAVLATSLLLLGTAAQARVNHPYGDRDHDGIVNRYDHDRDGDGIRNRKDPHPNRYDVRYHRVNRFGPRGDLDRDGIQNRYDRDRDGDGVANRRDRFPNDRRRS